MTFVRGFLAFWYDFIVGDDWLVGLGVIGLLAVVGLLAHASLGSFTWPLVPLGVALILALTLRRAPRRG